VPPDEAGTPADGGPPDDVKPLENSPSPEDALAASRRRLVVEAAGIVVSATGFGFVYGLAARDAGFSPVEAMAMSALAFGGAAQFAAVGYVAGGLAWPGVVLLTALLNARHLLYSAAIAPWLRDRPFGERAVMAHLLTDEAFALSMSHFRRLGRADTWGYWAAGIGATFIPWNIATLAGVLVGGSIAEPNRFGIDVIFPAAMIGLAVGLISGRREIVAAISGAAIGVLVALVAGPAIGIIAGGLIGPAVGLAVPARLANEGTPVGSDVSARRFVAPDADLRDVHDPRDEAPG
jgi:predicted branched-subunit amino acid permease